TDTCVISVQDRAWTFYRARQKGQFAGAAFEASSDQGYSGTIRIMAGVSADDKVSGVAIIEQMETPGLGARIAEPSFTSQFRDRAIQATKWAVTKDGGDINAITGATISPRAVVEALKTGLNVYEQNKQRIAAADSKDQP
ncbi:MAG: RnfABCDGE type electron transport complex subunit G, partial [Lentisphaerae bacterium]|nr:RnfABCDGE type electron transport complex subunit G [Lentisphaerota bacterium]